MKPKSLTLCGLAAAGALTALVNGMSAQPAAAAIQCEGNFQINRYGPIATPYCEDNYLAQVAREHGMNVSASAIRGNPGIKERVCRLVGYDNRVKSTCAPYLPDGDRRFHLR